MTATPADVARRLPPGFIVGTATAAYQIEGSVNADGRGVSIWDVFAHTPGKTRNGDTGDIACDHYLRWADDLDLMHSLGLRAYRLNVSWARLQPTGRGELNPAGVAFYRRLLEGCHERGIRPFVTLYHWDLPQALQDEGGWTSRDTAVAFADYARRTVQALGDLAEDWITINEAWCVAFLGHSWGLHAPGLRDEPSAVRAMHHVLLGHGLAVPAIRAVAPHARVGITNLLANVNPATDNDADRAAAELIDIRLNRITLDPLYRGTYGDDVFRVFGPLGLNATPDHGALVQPGDTETIAVATDFAGVNHYTNVLASADAANDWSGVEMTHVPPTPSSFGWSNTPSALADVLTRVNREYTPLPILVTENGISLHDYADPEGNVKDPERIDYIAGYLSAVGDITPAVPVEGYFIWSFLDNFEWAEGYEKRFGLIYVDYPTQQRTPKSSALWVRDLLTNKH